ncbi:MAG: alpha/beta fold hydrolase [Nanoarchaeota archaeon]|nr:alpha/beta fold hydrolase [Nanoarchaeota archaeon]
MVKEINLKSSSDKEFFMIHGYTGSPTGFGSLPKYLHKKFRANVRAILLRGHGTKISDLDNLNYHDFVEQIEEELIEDLKKGRKIVLLGICFGAQIALYLSTKYRVEGVIAISPPYKWRFPFNIPGFSFLGLFKKYWKKSIGDHERRIREKLGDKNYGYMHCRGLKIARKAGRELRKRIQKIDCPCLVTFSIGDKLGHYKSAGIIIKEISSKIKKKVLFEEKIHNLFYSPSNKKLRDEIVMFICGENLFNRSRKKKETIAAIVPAYNEGKRIGEVLNVLLKVKFLNEIVVIDDGSSDDTEEIIRKFMKNSKKIRLIKNKKNVGKGASIEEAVASTKAEIIFFCDADLIDFSPDIVEEIVTPIKYGLTDMFIGLRKNFMQRTIHLFAINSGERAMRREIWEGLPEYFKKRYRVEAGLNHFVKRYRKGFDYKILDYSQPIKEKKYGFWKGFILRGWMNFDAGIAYFLSAINNLFKKL